MGFGALRVHPGLATILQSSAAPAPAAAQHSALTGAIATPHRSGVGRTNRRGTIVSQRLYSSAGANVSALRRAGTTTGLTVYPAIDHTQTSPSKHLRRHRSGRCSDFSTQQAATPRPGGPNSTEPPGLQPETLVEDVIKTGGADVDSARNAGFTTALTLPRSGIWIGQSALINLAGDTPQQMIVRSPVAMHVGFTPLRGTYPGSLMGVFATLRQMMLDAQRYRDSWQIYEHSPRGVRRPDTDRSLAAWNHYRRKMLS